MKSNYFTRFLILACLLIGISYTADAQKKVKSPPKTSSQTIGALTVDINYNAPSVRGRKIWGGLEAYGEVWRTGANNATTFSINQDITIDGTVLPAGTYALFTIPEKDQWTIIINKEADQWGSYNYQQSQDALRLTVTPNYEHEFTEQMTFEVQEDGEVSLMWEKLKVSFNLIAEK